MRRGAFLISFGLLASFTLAAPPPFEFTPPEQTALAAAQEDASAMPQAQRLLLLAAMRRAIASGQLDRLTREQKTAMMDAAYQASSDDASKPGIEPEERKRRLRDWVRTYDELERAVYPMLTPDPNRYIIGVEVGAVGLRTPVREAPNPDPRTEGQPTADPAPARAAPRPGPAPAPPPPTPPDARPGDRLSAGAEGWSPSPGAADLAEAASGPPPGVGAPADLSRAAVAVGKGAGAAAALADGTRSSPGAPSGPGARPSAPRPNAAPPSATAGSGDPSKPATAEDLALAAGPYKPAFDAAGLRVERRGGSTALLRRDGSPASPAEQAALAAAVSSMPRAAMRDPAYLDPKAGGISWQRFQELKAGYLSTSGRDEFRHIALSGDARDFQRSESCDKISGGCNSLAAASYKKGEDVPAKELDSIWTRIHAYLAKSEAKPAPAGARRSALQGGSVWARVAAALGLGKSAPPAPAASSGSASAGPAKAAGSAASASVAQEQEGGGAAPSAEEPSSRRSSVLVTALFAAGIILAAVPLARSKWLRDI